MESPFLDPSHWIASNDLAAALRDRYPVSPGHTLIVPRRGVATVFDCTADEIVAIWRLMQECKRAIDAEFRPHGYNIGVNCGADAGQTIFHAHVHLIPRYRGDHPNPRGGVRHIIPGKGDYPPAEHGSIHYRAAIGLTTRLASPIFFAAGDGVPRNRRSG